MLIKYFLKTEHVIFQMTSDFILRLSLQPDILTCVAHKKKKKNEIDLFVHTTLAWLKKNWC